MPELPEVETMVRGIRAALEGGRLAGFDACPCSCRPILVRPSLPEIQLRTIGLTVHAVTRRAKRVVIELNSGDAFVIEPRMTGLMLLADPPDQEHLRLEWVIMRGRRRQSVWFWDRRGLGTVKLLSREERAHSLGDRFLGPDALDMTFQEWTTRLSTTTREIKVALLDQKLVAGIGNLYASEILHRCRIHPQARCDRLTNEQIRRLTAAVPAILHEAIRHEGSTLSDGTYRNALNQSGGYQNAHQVYDRADEPCQTCGQTPVVRIVQAQRSTFYCPRCQPPPRSRH